MVNTKFIHLPSFFSFIAEDNLRIDNSNIKVLIKSYTSSRYQTEVSCICAYSENHEYNSMLQTLHSKTNFLETSFLNKLILHSFQFLICTNIPHRVLDHQQKGNFPFFNKGFQNFCVKLWYGHYKKRTCNFFFHLQLLIIIRTKLLHSFFKI